VIAGRNDRRVPDQAEIRFRSACDVPSKGSFAGAFSDQTTAECQAGRGDDFSERHSCAKKLTHRRVERRPAKASVAVAGAGGIAALGTVS
jgi:hypothetical protein